MNCTRCAGWPSHWRMSAIVLSLGLALVGGSQSVWANQAQPEGGAAKPQAASTVSTKAKAVPAAKVYQPQNAPQPSQAAAASVNTSAGTILPQEVADIEGAPRYTLREAMRMAMQNSPNLDSARAAYRQAKGATEEAYTAGHPTVGLSAGYTFTVPDMSVDMGGQKISVGFQHNYNASLAINQVISTFGRLHYSVLASQMAEYSALEKYRQALEAQLAATANKYLNVLLAQESVVIAAQQLEAQKSSLRQAEDLYEGGTAAKFDVLSVRSAATSAELTLIEAKNALRLTKAALCSDMGLPIGTEFNVAPFTWEKIPDNVVSTYDLEESVLGALERRPEVKATQWAKDAAQARLELSRNNRNPSLALQSTVSNTRATAMSNSTMWVTSLVLSVPIYDGGVESAQSKQLEAAVEQLEANLENVRRGVRLDVEQCYYNLNSRWQRIVQARVGLDQAQEAYRVAEVRYGAGLSTPTELLESQSALVAAKRSLATAKYSYLGANVDWMLATSGAYPFEVVGPLDESDLKADLDAWYVSAQELRNQAVKLIDPVKDDKIPATYQETSASEPSLKKLSEQIKAQTIVERLPEEKTKVPLEEEVSQ